MRTLNTHKWRRMYYPGKDPGCTNNCCLWIPTHPMHLLQSPRLEWCVACILFVYSSGKGNFVTFDGAFPRWCLPRCHWSSGLPRHWSRRRGRETKTPWGLRIAAISASGCNKVWRSARQSNNHFFTSSTVICTCYYWHMLPLLTGFRHFIPALGQAKGSHERQTNPHPKT
jgi:hypothetical protein